jgi:sugar phosphate isomerase/epimerase
MIRRQFLQRVGSLASGALVWPALQRQRSYPMGLQLYTIRQPLAQDVVGTLKQVAALGYREVETYGFDRERIGYYGLPAKTFAQVLGDHGLTCPSGHYDLNRFASSSLDDLDRYVDQCIEGARVLRQSYITWPTLDTPSRTIDGFRQVAERLNRIGTRIAKSGVKIAYHNNGFDFVEQNGQIPYDIILKDTDPSLVKLQVDLYWLSHDSTRPPHEWFRRAPGRFVMWHVKDMHKVSRDYTELGNGTIDYTRIWPDAAMAGLEHFFVEQGGNFAHDPMRSIADCAAYVKRYLLK